MARSPTEIRFGIEEGAVEQGFQRLFNEGVAKPTVISPHTDGVPLFDNDSIRRFLANTNQLSPQSFPGAVGPDDVPNTLSANSDPTSTNDSVNGIMTLNSRIAQSQSKQLENQRIALAGIDNNAAVRATSVELGVLTMQQLALAPGDTEGQNQLQAKIAIAHKNRELAMTMATDEANRKVDIQNFDLQQQVVQDKARIENLKLFRQTEAAAELSIPGKMADAIVAGYNVANRKEAEIIAANQQPAQRALWFEASSNPEGVFNDWSNPNRLSDADNYTEYVINAAPPELREQIREHLLQSDKRIKDVSLEAQVITQQRAADAARASASGGGDSPYDDDEFAKSSFLALRKQLWDEAVVNSFHEQVQGAPPGALKPGQFDSQEEYEMARVLQGSLDPDALNAETAIVQAIQRLPANMDRELLKGAVANMIKAHRQTFNINNKYSGSLMDIQTSKSLSDSIMLNLLAVTKDATVARALAERSFQVSGAPIDIPGEQFVNRTALGVPALNPARRAIREPTTAGGGAGGGGGGGLGAPEKSLPRDVMAFIKTFSTNVGSAIAPIGTAVAGELDARTADFVKGVDEAGSAIQQLGSDVQRGIGDAVGGTVDAAKAFQRRQDEQRRREEEERSNRAGSLAPRG